MATLTTTVVPRRRFRLKATTFAIGVLILVVLIAIFADLIAPFGLNEQDYDSILQAPNATHWLGADHLGRDVLSRIIYGGRVSIEAMLVAVAVGAGIGIPIGVISGYAGGWVDTVIMRIADTLLAFPTLVLAIGVAAALGSSTAMVMIGVGIVLSPSFCRMARIQTRVVKSRLYVDAARSFGKSPLSIVVRHIAPNGFQPLLVQLAHMFGVVLMVEASLSFLGLGAPPPNPSWGSMLKDATTYSPGLTMQVIAPGLAIAIVMLAINIIGDAARDGLDPRLARRLDRASA